MQNAFKAHLMCFQEQMVYFRAARCPACGLLTNNLSDCLYHMKRDRLNFRDPRHAQLAMQIIDKFVGWLICIYRP